MDIVGRQEVIGLLQNGQTVGYRPDPDVLKVCVGDIRKNIARYIIIHKGLGILREADIRKPDRHGLGGPLEHVVRVVEVAGGQGGEDG